MGRFKTTKTRSKPNRNKLLKTNSDNNIKYYDKKKQNPNKKKHLHQLRSNTEYNVYIQKDWTKGNRIYPRRNSRAKQ